MLKRHWHGLRNETVHDAEAPEKRSRQLTVSIATAAAFVSLDDKKKCILKCMLPISVYACCDVNGNGNNPHGETVGR